MDTSRRDFLKGMAAVGAGALVQGSGNDIRRIDEQLEKQRGNLEGMRSELKAIEDRQKSDRESLAHWGDGLDDNSICLRVRFVRTPSHWAGGFPPKRVSGLSPFGPGCRCRNGGGGSLGLAARRPAIVLVRRRGKTG